MRSPAGLKLVALALIWAYLVHFTAGMRHLLMEVTHSYSKQAGKWTAVTSPGAEHGPDCGAGREALGLF